MHWTLKKGGERKKAIRKEKQRKQKEKFWQEKDTPGIKMKNKESKKMYLKMAKQKKITISVYMTSSKNIQKDILCMHEPLNNICVCIVFESSVKFINQCRPFE